MSKKCLKNDVEKLKTAPPKKASFCRNTQLYRLTVFAYATGWKLWPLFLTILSIYTANVSVDFVILSAISIWREWLFCHKLNCKTSSASSTRAI